MEIKMKVKDFKLFWNIIIFVFIGIILMSSYLFVSEIFLAKKGCENLDGNYKLNSFKHTCNNETLIKYSDGSWNYENIINQTKIYEDFGK